jgi:hypothetical protein
MHEKRGDINPAHTPDTEHVLTLGEKRSGAKATVRQLDDDVLKRLASKAASDHEAPPK